MSRISVIGMLAIALAGSTMALAQDQDEQEQVPFQKDPRGASLEEALDPTSGTIDTGAQDFFDSFETNEPSLDEPSPDELSLDELNLLDDPLLDDPSLGDPSIDAPSLDNPLVEEPGPEDPLLADDIAIPAEEELSVESDPQFDPLAEDILLDGPYIPLATRGTGEGVEIVPDEDISLPIPDEYGISRVATVRGLDKITARVRDIEVPVGRPVMFERFEILVQTCSRRPPEETPETTAFVQITEHRLDGELETVFSGWMFASSPAMNPVEHPVYDVWLIHCKTL